MKYTNGHAHGASSSTLAKRSWPLTRKRKTSTIHLNHRRIQILWLGCLPITESETITILGTTFHKHQFLTEHCRTKSAKAQRKTNLLRRMKGTNWGYSTKTGLFLYKRWIRPTMEYAPAAVALAPPTAIEILAKTERRAIRIAMNATNQHSNDLIYQVSEIEPFATRIQHLKETAIQRYQQHQSS